MVAEEGVVVASGACGVAGVIAEIGAALIGVCGKSVCSLITNGGGVGGGAVQVEARNGNRPQRTQRSQRKNNRLRIFTDSPFG